MLLFVLKYLIQSIKTTQVDAAALQGSGLTQNASYVLSTFERFKLKMQHRKALKWFWMV